MAYKQSNSQMNQIFNYNSNQNDQQQITSPTTKAYYSHSHASPYVNGKKNTGFAHPSFVSNQVFYSQDNKNKTNNVRQDYEEPRNQRQERNEPAGNRYRDDREDNYGDNDRYQGRGETRGNQDYRDDRSEGSALSSANYICPNCLNRHLSEDQRNLCRQQREEDVEKERRITDHHNRIAKEEEAQQRFNRSRRIDEGHDLKDKLDREYNDKLEYRRSPKKDGSGSGFQTMFERQEDLVQRQKNMNQAFGSTLQDQIRHQSHQKYLEKERNSSPYSTSLQIGEGYHNRYLDGRAGNLGNELKEQVEDRAYQQRKERELEKRFAQERTEQEIRQNEEEERRRKERELRQKRDYKDDLLRTIEDKKSKQREELASRQSERSNIDRGYAEYKRRQAEEEERAKRQLHEFGQNLKNQQDNSSYRSKYEERRQHKEQTSFDPASKSKKLYPCGDCHVPYEKPYLTKYE